MIKIGVSGARGKMGQRIIALAKEDGGFDVVFGLEKNGHFDIGKTIEGVLITDDFCQINDCDCLIDFSSPESTIKYVTHSLQSKKALVIGTTGLQEAEQAKIKEASRVIPIVFSPNMSVGVNLLFNLLNTAAKVLKGYKVDIEEAHHIHKKDSPSGTAKKIAEIISGQGFNIKTEDIKAIREGEIVGDHKIIFESDVDRIELSHHAKTRDIFAQGALRAAKWVVKKQAGLYSMGDML